MISMAEVALLLAILAIPACLVCATIALVFGFRRARAYRRRLAEVESALQTRVIPFLERRAKGVSATAGRASAVVLGPDGALMVKPGGHALEEAVRLVELIELRATSDDLAQSDTMQMTPTPSPDRSGSR